MMSHGKFMGQRGLAIVAVLSALAACSTPPLGPVQTPAGAMSSHVQIVNATELPPPDGVAPGGGLTRPYLIGPGDVLTIGVYGVEDLASRDVRADASGRISFPLAGSIDAAGKTTDQIASEIAQRLRAHYIRDPQVTVNLKEAVSRVVTVDGEVREPGLYPVLGRMTLMRAVATAKGLGDLARPQAVVVFRTVNGQSMAALYNLAAIRRGVYDDPEVYAGDVVIVGDSQARRFFRDMIQVLPTLTTPLILLLQRN